MPDVVECPYCYSRLHIAQGQTLSVCICGATWGIDKSTRVQKWTKPNRHTVTYEEDGFQKIKQHRKDSGD